MRDLSGDADPDDLTPIDGLCDIFLEFDNFQARSGSPHGDVTFRFVQRKDGQEKVLATMRFAVRDHHDGFPGMMGRAYDQMVAVLRQGLYTAGKMRSHYRHELATRYPRNPHRI